MTSTERGRAFRAKHRKARAVWLTDLQASWTLADEATRLAFMGWVDSVQRAPIDPMEAEIS